MRRKEKDQARLVPQIVTNDKANVNTCENISAAEADDACSAYCSDTETFGSPGSPPLTPISPTRSIVQSPTSNTVMALEFAYKKLEKQLRQTTEHREYYRKELEKEEKKTNAIKTECRRKITSIRHFWKDLINTQGEE